MLRIGMFDHVERALANGKHVCLMSFDVAGAFDCVSHMQLIMALKKQGADGYL